MLKSRTLFILGAGASFDFGLPIGKTLAKDIAAKTNIKFSDGYTQTHGDVNVMEAIRVYAKQNSQNANDYLAAGRTIATGIPHTRSIDSFLHKHESEPKLVQCAKLAIAQSIMEHEKHSTLFIDRDKRHFRDAQKVEESWLQDWFYVLQEEVSKSQIEKLLSNLMIVNFNYDRCIEQYLRVAISATYPIDQSDAAEFLNKKLNIIRPYGSLGKLPWQGNSSMPFGGHEYSHPDYLLEAASGIHTFNEEMQDEVTQYKIKGMIQQAKRICFLGFHFHEANMRLLKFDRDKPTDVQVYATAYQRADGAIDGIRSKIGETLGISNPKNIHVSNQWDCKKFFAEHSDALSA